MIYTNARILTFDATNRVIDSGSVEVRADGSIGAVTSSSKHGADAIDAGGRLLMPALINCHSHLYGTFARGIALKCAPPATLMEILRTLWWRLDLALNEEDVYLSALVGLIDSAKNGVGTLIDHHSSPNACKGSLDSIARAFAEVGLRGATCFETSDRNGPRKAEEGIRENMRFIERTRHGLVEAAFGLHAGFTLLDRTLAACCEANQNARAPFHVHVAEDDCDCGAVRRLCDLRILDEHALAAHCVRVTTREMQLLAKRSVNVIHNPQSNCNNAIGMAKVAALVQLGVTVGLGSDGYSPSMWDEFKTALHVQKLRARDPRAGYAEAYAAAFLNNRDIVKKLWGMEVGRIETGARADMILVDYYAPTPMTSDNLFGHLLFGIANAPIDSLIVDGRYVVREKQCVNVDERRVAAQAARCAKALWERMQ
jgi:putative selenium metabolism protein SsnA